MPYIWHSPIWADPRVKPPFGAAEINPGVSLGRDVAVLLLYNEGAGQPRNHALSMPGLRTGGLDGSELSDWAVNGADRSLYYSAITRSTQIATDSALNLPTLACTVGYVRRKVDTTLRGASHFGTMGSASFNAHVPYSDGTVYWDFGGSASPNRLTWGGYSPSTAVERWLFTAGLSGSAIYFQGARCASQSTAITRSNAGIVVAVNQGNVGSGDVCEVNQFVVWRRELTPGEIQDWHACPYAMLQPVIRRRWFVPAAAPTRGKNTRSHPLGVALGSWRGVGGRRQ